MIDTPKPTRRDFAALLAGATAAPLLASLAPRPAHATGTPRQIRRAINLAGRQRMLSQRMARATCFLRLEMDPERHLAMLAQAVETFDVTLAGLRDGSEALELGREGDALVLQGIAAVEEVWQALQPEAEAILARGQVTDAGFAAMNAGNVPLLFTSDGVVDMLVLVHGARSGSAGNAAAINIAGRQRMLSQKMAKEVALIALGIEPEDTRRALRDTARLFEQSLEVLIAGEPEYAIPRPPEHIRAKLQEVAAIWADYGAIVKPVSQGGGASRAQLERIAERADPLLFTMNDAVTLFQNLGSSQG